MPTLVQVGQNLFDANGKLLRAVDASALKRSAAATSKDRAPPDKDQIASMCLETTRADMQALVFCSTRPVMAVQKPTGQVRGLGLGVAVCSCLQYCDVHGGSCAEQGLRSCRFVAA